MSLEVEPEFSVKPELLPMDDPQVEEDFKLDTKDAGIIYQDWSDSDAWAAMANSGANIPAIEEIHDRYVHSAPQLRRRFGHLALHAGTDGDAGSGSFAEAS